MMYLLTSVLLAATPLCAQKNLKALKSIGSLAEKASLQILEKRNLQLQKQLAQLQREHALLVAQNAKEQSYQTRLFDRAKRATFRAVPNEQFPASTFTGTVFEVLHNGRKEVFGAVAMHILQDVTNTPGMLDKDFSVVIVRGNRFRTLPARVVQLSSSAMGDIALVKFRPEDERLFQPLSLEEISLSFPAQGYAQGYACNLLSKQTFPIVGNTSIGMLKSHLPAAEKGKRAGFCGSPVFTTDFKFAGIHVGSSYKDNTGYIAPLSVLQNLVDSYHTPNTQPQVLLLAGKEIGRLAIDEHAIRIEFLDADYQVIWEKNTKYKFSLTEAEQKIQQLHNVSFIRLHLRKSYWHMDKHGSHLLENSSSPRVIVTPWLSK